MENEQGAGRERDLELLCELHAGLERQGPGSPEVTLKALGFVDELQAVSRTADLGCGTGGQTMVLAEHMGGEIVGLDRYPGFIATFNENAGQRGLGDRVRGIVGSMEALPFRREELDLIWSEGAIGGIGFERGLRHWRDFLKTGGHIAVTYESWFTDERPAEIEKFWLDAVPEMNTIGHNISVLQRAGYRLEAAFTLPEECWTDNYYIPREAALKPFLEKYAGNETAEALAAAMRYEAELYGKYKPYYGYVFYIAKKI